MKVGILGGRFDPPHIGHLLVAQQTLEFCHLDQIWFIPCFQGNLRSAVVASPLERLEMTRFLEKENLRVWDGEIRRKGVSFAIDTVLELKKKLPHEFFWILGSDLVKEFPSWKESERLKKEIPFLVFPRLGFVPPELPKGFSLIHAPPLIETNISSTVVRRRLKEGLSIEWLVPEEVRDYIVQRKLYQ